MGAARGAVRLWNQSGEHGLLGLHGLSLPRFLLIDALGCALGAAVFTGLGYLVSGSAMVLLGQVRRIQLWLLGALVVGIVIVYLVHRAAKYELHIEESEREP